MCAILLRTLNCDKLLNKLQNKRGNYPKQVLLQDNLKDKLVTAGIIHRKLYRHVLTVCVPSEAALEPKFWTRTKTTTILVVFINS